MYDTARRVALVKQRVRKNTRRRQRREVISLSAACILLLALSRLFYFFFYLCKSFPDRWLHFFFDFFYNSFFLLWLF